LSMKRSNFLAMQRSKVMAMDSKIMAKNSKGHGDEVEGLQRELPRIEAR
jgi:hypothetical protein